MITPQFLGQTWTDDSTGIIWKAVSLDPGAWVIEAKKMQIEWVPFSAPLHEQVGYFNENPIIGISSVTFRQLNPTEGFRLQKWMDTTTMLFPGLITCPLQGMQISNCPLLTSISFPNFLPSWGANIILTGNAFSMASSDHVMARCVASTGFMSGIVDMTGGTSIRMSLQGLKDKKTLLARGVQVLNN